MNEKKKWINKVRNATETHEELTVEELIDWLSGFENNMDKKVLVTYDTGYGVVPIRKKCLKITDKSIILCGDWNNDIYSIPNANTKWIRWD